jgi:hypothetical protein
MSSARALADVVRAGYRVLHEPSMQVEYEIHHLADGPGRLAEIVGRQDTARQDTVGEDAGHAGFAETLSTCANGVGLVIGTRVGTPLGAAPPRPGSAEREHTAWVQLDLDESGRAAYSGSERPNLTFQHESAETFEGVISIEDEPRRLLLRHGLMIADACEHIAETALHAGDAALLSIQCPAQLPPTNSFWEGGGIDGRVMEPGRSSSLAIRFRMALERPSADLRLQLADRLARHCEERGLGLWLEDTRPGYRAGNWFLVLPHDRASAREATYRRAARHRGAGNAAQGCLPLTMVGPARQGSVHAVLSFLGGFPGIRPVHDPPRRPAGSPAAIPLLACSMNVLDELAFLHLQLGVSGASRARMKALTSELAELRATALGPHEVLPRMLGRLTGGQPEDPPDDLAGALRERAGDYRTVLGPALPIVAESKVRRIPIWISWRMPRSDAGLRSPLLALQTAVNRLCYPGIDPGGPAPDGANIEYLVCHQMGPRTLRGKGKLAVSRELVDRRSTDPRRRAAQFAQALEEAWRAQLRMDGDDHRFSEISVSSREFLLGDGDPLS